MTHISRFSTFPFLVLLGIVSEGCFPSRNTLTMDTAQTEEISRQSEDRAAYIISMNGDTVRGYRVAVRDDSTEWYEKDSTGHIASSTRHVAPTSGIASVSISTPKELDDLLIGAGAGALIGAIVYAGAKAGQTSGQDQSLGDILVNALALNIGFGGCTLGLGAFGGLFGLVEGAQSRTSYDRAWAVPTPEPLVVAGTDSTRMETSLKIDTTIIH